MVQAVATQETKYRLVLELTPNELVTLQAMMQNTPFMGDGATEPEDATRIRRAIFEACSRHRT
ncbi:hypothetical protein HWB09_gp045 [Pectobacterium phage vB_PatP_CB4]|uniref:Uncharacterized protein n=1 Tax=Pectobacterium phage vB_PatP_CB4 TaxID=1958919 RepID=A0A2P9J4Y1_9CAUD|nr:hypothetical protein HWB09_gp045 [Pectobacterium phage vB_PatP_CB4]AQT27887.1 hypothetical protein CB4_45 [Pectobacterium phage vB_PatP_CB4]